MSFVRVEGDLPGDMGSFHIGKLATVKIKLVGFLNGGDAVVVIRNDTISIFPRQTGFGYTGSILDWLEAARTQQFSEGKLP